MSSISSICHHESGTQEMLIEEILVSRGSRFDRTTVGTSGIHREFGSMVLAVPPCRRRNSALTHRRKIPSNGGDYLIVMGEPAQLSELENAAAQVLQKT